MAQETGKFSISYVDLNIPSKTLDRDGIYLGRLDKCEILLDHSSVSRIHAGINHVDSRYVLINLSSSNVLTLNGRLLKPQKSDVLADGDTIQIGPFVISVGLNQKEIVLVVEASPVDKAVAPFTGRSEVADQKEPPKADGVLKVFWEKRSREKDDWGSLLRPTAEPVPGKSMFNWKPTGDLRRRWRVGLFIWSLLMVGAIGSFAYLRYPNVYSPMPLADPHARDIEYSPIAAFSNGNSCTTCHTPNEPLENSCVRCHQAQQFHASNTKAHEEAGITCTSCHKEHRGADFDMKAAAIESCAQCHEDSNRATYNGKSVATAHGGSYGYPVVDGAWKWKGVYREAAVAIPELNYSVTGDKDEQARLSRHFHTIHVGRLTVPPGIKGDSRGLVSCSSCHDNFKPIDKVTPKQTCSACHSAPQESLDRDMRSGEGATSNCISCHVQHPYSGGRWGEFLTEDALNRRKEALSKKIEELKAQ